MLDLQVIRGGRRVKVSIYHIVVGDVVPLSIGDLVTGVGIDTEWGLLMSSISEDNDEETPVQVGLDGVATFIGILGFVVAISVLAIDFIRYFTGHTKNPDGTTQFLGSRTKFKTSIQFVIIAVTNIMVSVPEGLPIAFTLMLYESENIQTDDGQLDQWEFPEDDLVLLAIIGIELAREAAETVVDEGVEFLTSELLKAVGDNQASVRSSAAYLIGYFFKNSQLYLVDEAPNMISTLIVLLIDSDSATVAVSWEALSRVVSSVPKEVLPWEALSSFKMYKFSVISV